MHGRLQGEREARVCIPQTCSTAKYCKAPPELLVTSKAHEPGLVAEAWAPKAPAKHPKPEQPAWAVASWKGSWGLHPSDNQVSQIFLESLPTYPQRHKPAPCRKCMGGCELDGKLRPGIPPNHQISQATGITLEGLAKTQACTPS